MLSAAREQRMPSEVETVCWPAGGLGSHHNQHQTAPETFSSHREEFYRAPRQLSQDSAGYWPRLDGANGQACLTDSSNALKSAIKSGETRAESCSDASADGHLTVTPGNTQSLTSCAVAKSSQSSQHCRLHPTLASMLLMISSLASPSSTSRCDHAP